ncbi:MAG TPA: hypothetical protein VFL92_02720 [Sphingomonas sp.]|nr:hypothetical protein [Sphingomonas sp.]
MMMRITIAALALLAAAPAAASTPSAWAKERAAAAQACQKASGLINARASAPIAFPDRWHMDAMLVSGLWPQHHMKRKAATMLCLYDRRTHHAAVEDAAAWSGPK